MRCWKDKTGSANTLIIFPSLSDKRVCPNSLADWPLDKARDEVKKFDSRFFVLDRWLSWPHHTKEDGADGA